MGLRQLSFSALFIFGCFSGSAQSSDHEEAVALAISSTNFIVGENLYLSAFIYSTETRVLSRLSSVLYVDIIDSDGNSVYQKKIGIKNGRAAGKIYINPEWSTDTYRLVAFTRWMRNFNTYESQPFLVFNPYQRLQVGEVIPGNPIDISQVDGTPYKILEKVDLELGEVRPSSLAIAVKKLHRLHYPNQLNLVNSSRKLESFHFLPEFNYGLIQGAIQNDTGGTRVDLSISGSALQVNTFLTDDQGRFWMNYNPALSGFTGYVKAENTSDRRISVFDEFYTDYPGIDQGQIRLDSATAKEIVDRSIQTQVERAYLEKLRLQEKKQKFISIKESKSYVLDEYTRFTTMRDTFIELLPQVGVSKSEDNYKMVVRCPIIEGFIDAPGAPLILLNGIRTDARTIFELSPNDVERIEVLDRYFFLKDDAFRGVVSVHTKLNDYRNFEPDGLEISLAEYQQYADHTILVDDSNSRIAQYRSLVYWDPVYDHPGGKLIINFTLSELTGPFVVHVQGLTQYGELVDIIRMINVQPLKD